MPTVKEVLDKCQWLVNHGRADEKAFLALPGVENRRKMKKPPKRFTLGADEPFVVRLLAQKERYFAKYNKTVALEIWCSLLEAPTEEQLDGWASGGQS
jgi:hypothetical protein